MKPQDVIRIILNLLLIVAATLVFVTLPPPQTVMSVAAETESVHQTVVTPSLSEFFVPRGYVDAFVVGENIDPGCLERAAKVRPGAGAGISYVKTMNGDLVIAVGGPAVIDFGDRAIEIDVAERVRFVIGKGNNCSFPARMRLPTGGDLSIGEEPAAAADPDFTPALLREGVITVHARAADRLFGIPLSFGPFEPGSLYLADRFELPAASVVTGARRIVDGKSHPAVWWGYVDATFEQGAALSVRASANAHEARLINLALFDDNDKPRDDRISLTLPARLIGDPNLRLLYAFVGILLVLSSAIRRKPA